MATRETADLGEAHPPRHESIRAFDEMAHELRRELVHLRHQHDKHVPESFAAAKHLADHELAAFSADDFVLVRVATTAYGLILFGKLRIPALAEDAADTSPAYIHFRAFTDGPEQAARFHSFYTEELDTPTTEGDGHLKTYRTLFSRADVLDWFDA